jgi:hypothetical protein
LIDAVKSAALTSRNFRAPGFVSGKRLRMMDKLSMPTSVRPIVGILIVPLPHCQTRS